MAGRQVIPALFWLALITIFGCYADMILREEIVSTARLLLQGVTYIILISLAIFLFYYLLRVRERFFLRRAERRQAEREADVYVIVSEHGVFAREMNPQAVWRPLHLNVATYQNGKQVAATLIEQANWHTWQMYHSKRVVAGAEPLMLPAQTEPQPLPDYVDLAHYASGTTSLRSVFLGIGRYPDGQIKPISAPLGQLVHIATGGSSGFGKSTMMLGIAYQVINAREQPRPVMLDAQGLTFTPFSGDERLLYPLASDTGDILKILLALVGEMRHREELFRQWRGVASLQQYNSLVELSRRLPEIPVFLDEFGLLAKDKKISRAIDELSKGARKTGISLIAGAQTWGHDEISTAIRANLSTTIQFHARDKNQSRILLGSPVAAEITQRGRAYAILPGQAGLIELQAPDTSNVIDVIPELIEAQAVELPEVEPTEEEAEILEMWDSGEERITMIAEKVLNGKGGHQNKKVREILEKFGRV